MFSIAQLSQAAAIGDLPRMDDAKTDLRVTPRRPLRPLWLGLLLSLAIHMLLVWLLPKPAEKNGRPRRFRAGAVAGDDVPAARGYRATGGVRCCHIGCATTQGDGGAKTFHRDATGMGGT